MVEDVAAIAGAIRTMYAAFARHDPAAIEDVLHPDCTVWDVFTPQLIRGREQREAFHAADQAQMRARGELSFSLTEPLVDVWDDTAVARYTLTFSYAPPNATAGVVRISDVLRRQAGRWRIVHHHEGLVPQGVPPIV